jgi:hypothetical protein
MQEQIFFSTISADDKCLDPHTCVCARECVCAVRSHTGCGEVDIGVDLPSHALSEGSHRAGAGAPSCSWRSHDDRASCDGQLPRGEAAQGRDVISLGRPALCLRRSAHAHFGYSTDFNPTRDLLEGGLGFHGAALFINQTRGTITDTGFVTTPPLSRGTHQLRVSLFDHQGEEIEHSTSASITLHVSPPAPAASAADADGSRVHGASRLGKGEGWDEGGCEVVWPTADLPDVALAALAAAATPWRRNSPRLAARGSAVDTTSAEEEAGGHEGGGRGGGLGGVTWSLCPPLVVHAVVERPLPPNELQVVEIDYRREEGKLWRLDGTDSGKFSLRWL